MNIDINFFDEILKEAKKTNELVNLINEEYSKVDVLMYNKFGSNSIWNNHFMNIYDYIYDELQTKNDEIKYNANRAYCIFKYSDFPTIFEDFDEKLNIESYFSFNSLLQASYGNIKIYDLLSFDIDNSGPFNENSKIIVLRGKLLEAFLYCFSQELIKGEKPDFLNATNYNYEGDTIYSVELNYDGLIEYYKKHRDEELLSQLDSFSFEEIDKKELIINDLLSSINLFLENQIKLNNIFPDKTLNIGSTDSMTESKILNITTDDLIDILSNDQEYNSFFSKNKRGNYNIYLHAFNVLYNELFYKNITLDGAEIILERLEILSNKYVNDYNNMKLESQKYKEAYEKEMATATYKNVNGFDCIISSNWNNESTIEEATSIANSLPYILKKEIKEIAFIIEGGASIPYWSFVFSDSDFTPVASATSIINRLTIYEPYIKEIEVYKENTIYHEAAHFYDYSHNISESEEWKNASNKDGSYPSYYAQSNQKENWAESVAYYFEDPEKFKRDFPNRTIVIERAMGINNKQNKAEDEEYYFSEIDNNN